MIRLALRVKRSESEFVLADLLELAPEGVEEIELPCAEEMDGVVEYAVYGAPGELPDLPDLRAAAAGALVEISTSEVPDDWSERWRQFHRPILVEASGAKAGDSDQALSLRVRPPWEPSSDQVGMYEIVIDPAQAFGTGAHATTRLCLELLLELAGEGVQGSVIDIGSGSGVLAIAASKLGHSPVLALDNDRASVVAIADNAARNDVQIEARRFDLRHDALPEVEGAMAPIVLANLLKPLLLELAESMAPFHSASAPKRFDLIASGLLCDQADEVGQAFARRLGLHERARRERGEWAALWLTSAPSQQVRLP
jgi:ribosomal protein L11 methyltransferase